MIHIETNTKREPRKLPFLIVLIEATVGFEPTVRVLQTLALPLGDVASMLNSIHKGRRLDKD